MRPGTESPNAGSDLCVLQRRALDIWVKVCYNIVVTNGFPPSRPAYAFVLGGSYLFLFSIYECHMDGTVGCVPENYFTFVSHWYSKTVSVVQDWTCTSSIECFICSGVGCF